MGKDTEKPVPTSSADESSRLLPKYKQKNARNRKGRALTMLGEYMRYFSSVNGLYHNIVHMQAEVVSKHGQHGWNSLSQEYQDQAFDSHIIKDKYLHSSFQGGQEHEESLRRHGAESSKQQNRRDSLQSILDQDSFSGTFSWKSKSLQNLVFPTTPEFNRTSKHKEGSKRPMDKGFVRLKFEPTEHSGASESEDEVTLSMTLDQLRRELRRNYEEQQAARLKIRQLEVEKNFGVQKEPEGITKAAVKRRSTRNRNDRATSDNMGGLPVSPADLKSASKLRPVNRDTSNTRLMSENSPTKLGKEFKQTCLNPAAGSQAKTDSERELRSKGESIEKRRPKDNPTRKSVDFDEILKAAEEAHLKLAQNSGKKLNTSLKHTFEATTSQSSSQIGLTLAENRLLSERKIATNEAIGEWSQYLPQTLNDKSQTENKNPEIMELFKNW